MRTKKGGVFFHASVHLIPVNYVSSSIWCGWVYSCACNGTFCWKNFLTVNEDVNCSPSVTMQAFVNNFIVSGLNHSTNSFVLQVDLMYNIENNMPKFIQRVVHVKRAVVKPNEGTKSFLQTVCSCCSNLHTYDV